MTITVTESSKEVVETLIRNEFHSINFEMDYIYGKADKLIQAANDFGLNDLSEELKNNLV